MFIKSYKASATAVSALGPWQKAPERGGCQQFCPVPRGGTGSWSWTMMDKERSSLEGLEPAGSMLGAPWR